MVVLVTTSGQSGIPFAYCTGMTDAVAADRLACFFARVGADLRASVAAGDDEAEGARRTVVVGLTRCNRGPGPANGRKRLPGEWVRLLLL